MNAARRGSPVEDRDGSPFGTPADPDGNAVQIIQLSAEPRAEMAGRHERPRRPPHVQRLSVNDLATAQAFYVDVLSVADETEHFFSLKLPEQTMLVYGKGAAHTPASYTVLTSRLPTSRASSTP